MSVTTTTQWYTPLEQVKLDGRDMEVDKKTKSQVILTTKGKPETETKAVFSPEKSKIEGYVLGKGKVWVEEKDEAVRVIWEKHIQYALLMKKGDEIADASVVMSPEVVKQLHGKLGNEIREAYRGIDAYRAAAEKLQKEMKAGETKEGVVEGGGFGDEKKPKVFVRLNSNSQISEFGIVGKDFLFIASEYGGIKNPAVAIKPQKLKELSDTQVGATIEAIRNSTIESAKRIEELRHEMESLREHPEIVLHMYVSPDYPRVSRNHFE